MDCWALTQKGEYCGLTVQGSIGAYSGGSLEKFGPGGKLYLWGPNRWPAKGLWLHHNLRYNRFYGETQYFGAWKPWRRDVVAPVEVES